ncbi:ankyrin repeat domain-containing protein [Silvimonas amylolytica]|uniref:Ankyrin repeat n=1 Tax=Silvimonas amylolytica TaxID=449663 RepID=A0ABQ2PNQ6_9NEIS|nr:ankyrin repeat domain-containing protein [Silvimonas amylolytica]GGP26956.1 hypothetical protein GCM10010971_27750 [Silvimonas amylolytica]
MTDPLREKLAAYKLEHRYPEQLAARFPRIVTRIMELWGTPNLHDYFDELLIMDRYDRQGFPPEIGAELMAVSLAHDQILGLQEEHEDIWEHVRESVENQLRELGFDASAEDFQRAVSQGNISAVLLFLEAGLPVDHLETEGQWTPLIRAAFEGRSEMALLLLQHGANIHAADRDGYTALHWAALTGHEEIIQLLVDRSVNVNQLSHQGFSALLQAASQGHEQVVRKLVAIGANLNTATNEGWTALHKAVANGHLSTAVALLDLGADATARHVDGETPLSLAQASNNKRMADLLSLAAGLQARQRARQRQTS